MCLSRIFDDIAKYCWKNSSSINLSIMVAFFTSTAIQRMFSSLTAMPGTYSNTCLFIMSLKPNIPEVGSSFVWELSDKITVEWLIAVFQWTQCRPLIAKYARWQVLSWILTFRTICQPLRQIYPDMVALEKSGLLLPEEKAALDQEEAKERDTPRPLIVTECKYPDYIKRYVPLYFYSR